MCLKLQMRGHLVSLPQGFGGYTVYDVSKTFKAINVVQILRQWFLSEFL